MQKRTPGQQLPFAACPNFRELGGYRGADGRCVRYGVFYRAPALEAIAAPADRALFDSLGIRTIFDFRSETERRLAPDPAFLGIEHIAVNALTAPDGGEQDFDLEKLIGTDAGLRLLTEGVHESYARMPFDNAAYRALFDAIRADKTPLLFHCTAGKDRTGVAAALILRALGVSRADIIADYLLTNKYRAVGQESFRARLAAMGLPEEKAALVARQAIGVRRESIESALDAIDARYPSFETYLAAELDTDAAALAALRARYLE